MIGLLSSRNDQQFKSVAVETRNSRARQGAPKAKFDAVYTSTEFDYLGFGLLLTTGS